MAKVPMKRIFIAGLKKERKQVLEALQRAGVVEVSCGDIEADGLETMNVLAGKAAFEKYVNYYDQALDIVNTYAPDENAGLLASLEGAKDISLPEYEARVKRVQDTSAPADELLALNKQIAEDTAAIPRLTNYLESLKPWMSLDVPLNFPGTEKTVSFIGSLKNEVPLETIMKAFNDEMGESAEDMPGVDVSIVSSSKEMTCLFVTCLKKDAAYAEAALKKLDFARTNLSGRIPAAEAENTQKKIEELEKDIESCKESIKTYANIRDDLKFASDYFQMRADKYEVLNSLPQTENAFFISGYIPEQYAESLKDRLCGDYDVEIEISDPAPDEEVPVVLSNNPFSDPMESVVESYSLPNKNEIDPSFIISLFYYVFFGLMLSDAGYGLLLTLGTGAALLKVKNMKPEMKKLLKLFFFSGISTIFWGIMFGSFFGDAVKVIANNFFGTDPKIPGLTVPVWFEPVSEPMRMLVFAFALGLVHLFTGHFLKGYLCLKNGDIEGFIYDVVFWAMFVGGGVVYLLSMDMVVNMMNLSFKVGPVGAKISAIIAAAGAVGIVFTGGRESKSWPKRLMKGAYAAYGVTGWLSDVLSYSRLLALGLATGVIAQVFNKMGSMLGTKWYGILIFILVFLIGHVLNLAINVLGAYVHTNRLQFVEFFGKFYEGGAKEFTPFTEKTKYYNVKEEK